MSTHPCSASRNTRFGDRSRATSARWLNASTPAAAPSMMRAHSVDSSGPSASCSAKLGCVQRSNATKRRPSPSPTGQARIRFGWSIAARAPAASRSRCLAARVGSLGSRAVTAPASCPFPVDGARTLPGAGEPGASGCFVTSPGVVEGQRVRLRRGRRRLRRGRRLVNRRRRSGGRRGRSDGRGRSDVRLGGARRAPWSVDSYTLGRLGGLHWRGGGGGRGSRSARRERRQLRRTP